MQADKLQKRINSRKPTPHIVFADFNVLLWKAISFYETNHVFLRNEHNHDVLLRAAIAYIFNRGPIELDPENAKIVVVADGPTKDLGGYWRHYEVERDAQIEEAWNNYKPRRKLRRYKDGRGEKSEFFHHAHAMAKEYCKKYLNYYRFEGFEADDIAGAVYRNFKTDSAVIKLWYTVDRDWSQLVAEEKGYYWYTPRVPRPNEWNMEQAMDNEDVIYYAERKLDYAGLKHPIELIKAKVIAGDAGDNLPPGCPAVYMDLIAMHPKYNIEENPLFDVLLADLADLTANVKIDHLEESDKTLSKMLIDARP